MICIIFGLIILLLGVTGLFFSIRNKRLVGFLISITLLGVGVFLCKACRVIIDTPKDNNAVVTGGSVSEESTDAEVEEEESIMSESVTSSAISDLKDFTMFDEIVSQFETDDTILLNGTDTTLPTFCNDSGNLVGKFKVHVTGWYFTSYSKSIEDGRVCATFKSLSDLNYLDDVDYVPQNHELYIDVTDFNTKFKYGDEIDFIAEKDQYHFVETDNTSLDYMDIVPVFTVSEEVVKIAEKGTTKS